MYYRSDGKAGSSNPGFSGYCFQSDPGLDNKLVVGKVTNGLEASPFQTVSMPIPPGNTRWVHAPHDISVAIKGDHHVISVGGVVVLDFHDSAFPSGMAELRG